MFALYAALYGFCFKRRQNLEWTLFFYKVTFTDETFTITFLSLNSCVTLLFLTGPKSRSSLERLCLFINGWQWWYYFTRCCCVLCERTPKALTQAKRKTWVLFKPVGSHLFCIHPSQLPCWNDFVCVDCKFIHLALSLSMVIINFPNTFESVLVDQIHFNLSLNCVYPHDFMWSDAYQLQSVHKSPFVEDK